MHTHTHARREVCGRGDEKKESASILSLLSSCLLLPAGALQRHLRSSTTCCPQDLPETAQAPQRQPLLHQTLQRPLTWCSGTAGVVNQAVANQRTATSQHQGHTALQAACTWTPAKAPTHGATSPPSGRRRTPPAGSRPQVATLQLLP